MKISRERAHAYFSSQPQELFADIHKDCKLIIEFPGNEKYTLEMSKGTDSYGDEITQFKLSPYAPKDARGQINPTGEDIWLEFRPGGEDEPDLQGIRVGFNDDFRDCEVIYPS
jgi:hypothetical protein